MLLVDLISLKQKNTSIWSHLYIIFLPSATETREVALRVTHSSLMSFDRMKPRLSSRGTAICEGMLTNLSLIRSPTGRVSSPSRLRTSVLEPSSSTAALVDALVILLLCAKKQSDSLGGSNKRQYYCEIKLDLLNNKQPKLLPFPNKEWPDPETSDQQNKGETSWCLADRSCTKESSKVELHILSMDATSQTHFIKKNPCHRFWEMGDVSTKPPMKLLAGYGLGGPTIIKHDWVDLMFELHYFNSQPPVYEKDTKIFVWNCALHSASYVMFDCCVHAHIVGVGGKAGLPGRESAVDLSVPALA
uniref:(California timema) hypothetical protein n=1 Tax=Timema californicum TaxID=61474 RepID=A0A7R9J494_TIMCA|nr:unnamed protein product [Timema californicum]